MGSQGKSTPQKELWLSWERENGWKETLQARSWQEPSTLVLQQFVLCQEFQGRWTTRVGTGDCIKDLDYLLDLGITHIINTSEQDVRIDPTKFAKQGICYKGFICKDMPGQNIKQYFEECAEFIDRALSMRCGMVFIAGYMGFSGSATIACAYLMLRKGYSATQALQYMRNSREVQPNLGFLQQLAEKDNELRKDRYRKYNYKLEEIKYSI